MAQHRIATQEEWQAERDELLADEKELTHRGDELTRRRQALPWVAVEKDYEFETAEGTKSLADLFGGRSQLLIYHFMFGPHYGGGGCPVCTSIADSLNPQVAHLAARDATLLLTSRAPIDRLLAYRERMEWQIGWASNDGDFNRELGFVNTPEDLRPFLEGPIPVTVSQNAEMCGTDAGGYVTERPGLSAYVLDGDTVYRTYVTTNRGLEITMGYYPLLDRITFGRRESATEPLWIRRHDEYQRA